MRIVDWSARIREGREAMVRSDRFALQLRKGFREWLSARERKRRTLRGGGAHAV